MKARIAVLAALVAAMAGFSPGQDYYWESPTNIRVEGLEKIMRDARSAAFRDQNAALEFEIVKNYIKDYVDGHRQSTAQVVDFDSADAVKRWLRDVAQRMDKDEMVLTTELLDAIAPNTCPELTGEDRQNYDYYRKRAFRDASEKRLPSSDEQPLETAEEELLEETEQTPGPVRGRPTPIMVTERTRSRGNRTSITIEMLPATTATATKRPVSATGTPRSKNRR